MFMRRGCMFGCFGWIIACLALGLLGWFLVLPQISGALEDGVSEGISTMIADEVDPRFSHAQLQQGADVPFTFSTINRAMQSSNDGGTVDNVNITSAGNRLLIRAEVADQTFEFAFIPGVTNDGRLSLDPVDGGGWFQRQILGILSGGFEGAINQWLDRNDLRLVDVILDGETIVLSVSGR
jgi:hypothetical protein